MSQDVNQERVAAEEPRVLLLDHAADPGGGQLGLHRYLLSEHGKLRATVVFLTGGEVAERTRAIGDVPVHVLYPEKTFRLARALSYVPRLARHLRAASYDVIVANSLYAALVLRQATRLAPTEARLAYYSRVSMETLRGPKRAIALNLVFDAFDAFISNSEWTASCIPARLGGNRYVAYPVSGIAATQEGGPARARPLSQARVRIVTLSRPDRWKGLDVMADAVRELAEGEAPLDVSLRMYGGGFYSDQTYLTELRDKVAALGGRASLEGHTDDVHAALAEADIFVLPSRDPEPFGQAVVQALAAGTIVIVPDAGGPADVVTDGVDGFLFEPGDPNSLADAIRRAAALTPDGVDRMTRAGASRAAQFSDDRTAGMLTDAVIAEQAHVAKRRR